MDMLNAYFYNAYVDEDGEIVVPSAADSLRSKEICYVFLCIVTEFPPESLLIMNRLKKMSENPQKRFDYCSRLW